MTTSHVHTIPVDPSQTTLEAWVELRNFGRRVTYTGTARWASLYCAGECGAP